MEPARARYSQRHLPGPVAGPSAPQLGHLAGGFPDDHRPPVGAVRHLRGRGSPRGLDFRDLRRNLRERCAGETEWGRRGRWAPWARGILTDRFPVATRASRTGSASSERPVLVASSPYSSRLIERDLGIHCTSDRRSHYLILFALPIRWMRRAIGGSEGRNATRVVRRGFWHFLPLGDIHPVALRVASITLVAPS